jgi:ABC-2 type transport system permease protein
MNTPSNAINESPIDSQKIAPAIISSTRPMYWSIRRELWENRSIYIAPLAVGGVVLFGFVIATIGRAAATADPAGKAAVMSERTGFAAGLIMAVAFVVGIFYSLDALHGERRDRSILFWKSLPVSDLTTVLSKASIPLVVLPLITIATIFATQLVMTLLSTLFLLGSGLSAANQWTSFLQTSLGMFYHLVTVHVLWHAPIYAWLLLVSAWARRAAFLWATLPLVAIGVLEKIAFNTAHFVHWMGYRLAGPESFELVGPTRMSSHHLMSTADPATFLSTPGLWVGLLLAALLLLATVRLRRYQGPI